MTSRRDELIITAKGHIKLFGRDTGLQMAQQHDRTAVWFRDAPGKPKLIKLPCERYSTTHKDCEAHAGRTRFIADLVEFLGIKAYSESDHIKTGDFGVMFHYKYVVLGRDGLVAHHTNDRDNAVWYLNEYRQRWVERDIEDLRKNRGG